MRSRTSSQSTLSAPTHRTAPLQPSISNQSAKNSYFYRRPSCQQEECEHGLLSPHASRPTSSDSNTPQHAASNRDNTHESGYVSHQPRHAESGNEGGFGGRHAGETDLRHGVLGDAFADGVFGSGTGGQLHGANDGKDGRRDGIEDGNGGTISTTQWLARTHGVRRRRIMYVLHP